MPIPARFLAALCLIGGVRVAVAQVNIQPNPNGQEYTQVLFSGASQLRFDIVFLGDGFTLAEQSSFNARVDQAVAALAARQPYARRMCAFNVWRVNVVSQQSGIDQPEQRIFRNTELGCRFGDTRINEPRHCIKTDTPLACAEAAFKAPDADAVFVLVNEQETGGCAGEIVFASIGPGFGNIVTHELGHKVGDLADEYTCYVCNGSDDNRAYTTPFHHAPNLTIDTNRTTTKWAALIAASTPLPTTSNTPPGVVGLWQGGGWYATGIFRPQLTCHMKDLPQPFCAVCDAALDAALSAHCTPCEVTPSAAGCSDTDLRGVIDLRWHKPVHLRWPIPPCLQCPVGEPELVVLELGGVPTGFVLRVTDDAGRTVAESTAARSRVAARFRADPARRYTGHLISRREATGRPLKIVTELTRNGTRQPLPSP